MTIQDSHRGTGPAHPNGRGLRVEREELSPSELKVLRYLPTNLSRPEIASELSLSVNTVSTHVRNIYAKLGASDRSSAVQRARAAAPLGRPFEARFVTTVSFGGGSVPHGRLVG